MERLRRAAAQPHPAPGRGRVVRVQRLGARVDAASSSTSEDASALRPGGADPAGPPRRADIAAYVEERFRGPAVDAATCSAPCSARARASAAVDAARVPALGGDATRAATADDERGIRALARTRAQTQRRVRGTLEGPRRRTSSARCARSRSSPGRPTGRRRSRAVGLQEVERELRHRHLARPGGARRARRPGRVRRPVARGLGARTQSRRGLLRPAGGRAVTRPIRADDRPGRAAHATSADSGARARGSRALGGRQGGRLRARRSRRRPGGARSAGATALCVATVAEAVAAPRRAARMPGSSCSGPPTELRAAREARLEVTARAGRVPGGAARAPEARHRHGPVGALASCPRPRATSSG